MIDASGSNFSRSSAAALRCLFTRNPLCVRVRSASLSRSLFFARWVMYICVYIERAAAMHTYLHMCVLHTGERGSRGAAPREKHQQGAKRLALQKATREGENGVRSFDAISILFPLSLSPARALVGEMHPLARSPRFFADFLLF